MTSKPSWIAVFFVYLVFAAVVARTLVGEETSDFLPGYIRLELVYLILFTTVLWKSQWAGWMLHLYFALQSLLVFWMLEMEPEFDFIILLFALITFQVALLFSGWRRWIWVGILISLTGGPLIFYLGVLQGLARSLTTIAGEIVITAYLIAGQTIAVSQHESQELLAGLEDSHRQLKSYAAQVEELAAMQERNRLARELHDSVSQQIFSISLTARSAELLLDKDPARVPELLERLQAMTSEALGQLRSFITYLHPPQKS